MKLPALILIAFIAPAQGQQAEQLAFYGDGVTNRPAVHQASARYTPKAKKVKRKAKPKARAAKKAAPKPDPTRVLAAEYRPDEVVRCLFPVRVVGSQDLRESAAEDSAKKAWAEHVRWNFGESFMGIENAQDYQKRCSRSSIGEAMGAVLNRCEVSAKPCRPGMVKGVSE